MTEYIRREAVLKSLEYTTVWEAEAENVISLTLRAAREKVEKLPVLQEKDLFPAWRDPDKDPPKVEMNCTPFVRQYGILFRKWGVFVCQRDNESTTELKR